MIQIIFKNVQNYDHGQFLGQIFMILSQKLTILVGCIFLNICCFFSFCKMIDSCVMIKAC